MRLLNPREWNMKKVHETDGKITIVIGGKQI